MLQVPDLLRGPQPNPTQARGVATDAEVNGDRQGFGRGKGKRHSVKGPLPAAGRRGQRGRLARS